MRVIIALFYGISSAKFDHNFISEDDANFLMQADVASDNLEQLNLDKSNIMTSELEPDVINIQGDGENAQDTEEEIKTKELTPSKPEVEGHKEKVDDKNEIKHRLKEVEEDHLKGVKEVDHHVPPMRVNHPNFVDAYEHPVYADPAPSAEYRGPPKKVWAKPNVHNPAPPVKPKTNKKKKIKPAISQPLIPQKFEYHDKFEPDHHKPMDKDKFKVEAKKWTPVTSTKKQIVPLSKVDPSSQIKPIDNSETVRIFNASTEPINTISKRVKSIKLKNVASKTLNDKPVSK